MKHTNETYLRNTRESYTLKAKDCFSENNRHFPGKHIDRDTHTYKHWHLPRLELIFCKAGTLCIANTSNGVCYELTIQVCEEMLQVSCNCDRRVEKLCHHAYYALDAIFSSSGKYAGIRSVIKQLLKVTP